MNKCYIMTIVGKVQDVGFRGRVENFGRGFDLKGQVQNERNGNVKILYGGENGSIGNFEDVIRKVTVDDDIIENNQLPLDAYDNLPYPFGKVHTDDEEDVGRKLDIGNGLLGMLVGGQKTLIEGQNDIKTGLNNLTTTISEHNIHLEAILEKLANK